MQTKFLLITKFKSKYFHKAQIIALNLNDGITKFNIPVVNVSKLIPPIENYHLVLDLVLDMNFT